MKNIFFFLFSTILVTLILVSCDEDLRKNPPYALLAATQPGNNPEIFGLDIVSQKGRHEYAMSVSPKGDELLYSTETPGEGPSQILYSRFVDGAWTTPTVMNFTPDPNDGEMEAFFAPDGNAVYFTRYDSTETGRIYKVNRTENGWSEPEKVDSPVNDRDVFYPNLAEDGTLYYTDIKKRHIYKSEPGDTSVAMLDSIPLPFGGHAFVDPKEQFMLFDFEGDIYIAYRDGNQWGPPEKLDESINTGLAETSPTLTPDGEFLFFSRHNETGDGSDIYWVKADFLKK